MWHIQFKATLLPQFDLVLITFYDHMTVRGLRLGNSVCKRTTNGDHGVVDI
jgi:hypothetical protein